MPFSLVNKPVHSPFIYLFYFPAILYIVPLFSAAPFATPSATPSYTSCAHARRKGASPWILKISAKKGCLLSFEWEKKQLSPLLDLLRKTLETSHSGLPLKKILPTPMPVHRHGFHILCSCSSLILCFITELCLMF